MRDGDHRRRVARRHHAVPWMRRAPGEVPTGEMAEAEECEVVIEDDPDREIEVGLWCDRCLLPSVIAVPLVARVTDGLGAASVGVALTPVRYCVQGDHG